MALQKTLILESTLTATDAYHKITRATVIVAGAECRANYLVTSYVSKAVADAGGVGVASRSFSCAFDKAASESPGAQLYAALKADDVFFADAQDV